MLSLKSMPRDSCLDAVGGCDLEILLLPDRVRISSSGWVWSKRRASWRELIELRMSPDWLIFLIRSVPGDHLDDLRLLSFRITVVMALESNVGAIELNSIAVTPGCCNI